MTVERTTTRRERRIAARQKRILEAAATVFIEKGYERATTREIADTADVSEGTLYNYFPDKEAILSAYFQNKIADSGQELGSRLLSAVNISEKLAFLMDFLYQTLRDDRALAGIYIRFRLKELGDLKEFTHSGLMEGVMIAMFKAAQENDEIRSDLPPALLARNFHFLFMSFFIFNQQENLSQGNQIEIERIIDLFLHGASTN